MSNITKRNNKYQKQKQQISNIIESVPVNCSQPSSGLPHADFTNLNCFGSLSRHNCEPIGIRQTYKWLQGPFAFGHPEYGSEKSIIDHIG